MDSRLDDIFLYIIYLAKDVYNGTESINPIHLESEKLRELCQYAKDLQAQSRLVTRILLRSYVICHSDEDDLLELTVLSKLLEEAYHHEWYEIDELANVFPSREVRDQMLQIFNLIGLRCMYDTIQFR